jgi:BolA protein
VTAPDGRADAGRVEAMLRGAFGPDAAIAVRDDSHLHAGHAGALEGSHMAVALTSARFQGLPRAARHRLVYDALRPLLAPGGIHALAITAEAPGPTGTPPPPDPRT